MDRSSTPRLPWVPFALLYLAEGAPIGFLWWALPAWLREQGVGVGRITGLTALLVLPWALKFLWAPWIDKVRGGRWGLRGCIACFQVVMGLTLLPLIWLDPLESFNLFRWLVLAHALAASTQDVAIDALALRMVESGQRGRLNGAMQAGMLIGRALFGGGALMLAGVVGWNFVVILLIGGIWIPALALVCLAEPQWTGPSDQRRRGLTADLRAILKRRSTWQVLGFALTAGAAFELTGALAGPMLVDLGLSTAAIGAVMGIPILIATVTGGLIGGWMADRFTPQRLTRLGVIAFSLVTLVMALFVRPSVASIPLLSILLVVLYLSIGLFTAASYALFMNFSRPPLAATRFSTFMAATNGCEAWTVWCGGKLAVAHGYAVALGAMAGVSLLALFLVPRATADEESTEPSQP